MEVGVSKIVRERARKALHMPAITTLYILQKVFRANRRLDSRKNEALHLLSERAYVSVKLA